MQYKSINHHNFMMLQLELEENFEQGWRIDKDNMPFEGPWYYVVNLVKDDDEDKSEKEPIVEEPVQASEVKPMQNKPGRQPKGKV